MIYLAIVHAQVFMQGQLQCTSHVEDKFVIFHAYMKSDHLERVPLNVLCIFVILGAFLFIADIDDCLNNNCSGNGNCSDRVNGFYCYCNDGYYGITCEIGNYYH